ncbi:MAG: hypothetical protein ABID67_00585 [Candidatus Nealsonbacteria bacterium]
MQKKAFSIIGIIIILIILIGGGYFGWQYLSEHKESVEIPEQEQEHVVVDEATDWQTYKNEKHGFEIEYPLEWSYKVVSEKQIEFREKGKTYSVEESDVYAIGIFIYENPNNLTAEQIAEERKSKAGWPVEIKTLTVDNADVAQAIDYLQQNTIIVKNKKDYNIVTPSGLDKSVSEIYDKMVSTFRFLEIESEDETINWQTYRNNKYGYEIKYPANLKAESFTSMGGPSNTPIEEDSAIGIGLLVTVQPTSLEELAEMPRNIIIIQVADDFKKLAINQFSSNSTIGLICEKKEQETSELICKIDDFIIIMDSVFEKDGIFYEVLFNTMLSGEDRSYWDFSENIDIYKKTLSTFRFLE